MSQSEFAAAIRHAGDALGEPNTANKRLVQKWESGEHTVCRPNYRRALQSVTRMPYEQLGFRGAPSAPVAATVVPAPRNPAGYPYTQTAPAPAAEARTFIEDEGLILFGEPGDRLRFALERPGQADLEAIVLVETATSQLFDLEHHRPSRVLIPTVGRHVDDISALLAGTRRESLRRRLAVAGGQ